MGISPGTRRFRRILTPVSVYLLMISTMNRVECHQQVVARNGSILSDDLIVVFELRVSGLKMRYQYYEQVASGA